MCCCCSFFVYLDKHTDTRACAHTHASNPYCAFLYFVLFFFFFFLLFFRFIFRLFFSVVFFSCVFC